jgi:hypothetical protein
VPLNSIQHGTKGFRNYNKISKGYKYPHKIEEWFTKIPPFFGG